MIQIKDIVEGVANERAWTTDRTAQATKAYLAFLQSAGRTPISEDLDAIWHEHILHTRRYRQDCIELAGDFVDHEPAPGGVNGRLACCGANGK